MMIEVPCLICLVHAINGCCGIQFCSFIPKMNTMIEKIEPAAKLPRESKAPDRF
jgi:hypothetical protein